MNRDLFLWQGQTRRKGEKVWMDGSPVDSKWITGHGVNVGDGVFSIIYTHDPVEKHVVYTDTIRQFTGLTDKNGNMIFDGDILRNKKCFGSEIGLVEFRKGEFLIQGQTPNIVESTYYGFWQVERTIEVIGNKWDNPELLEEKEIKNERDIIPRQKGR